MKFLGLRLDEHDSNITFTDGDKVRYFKSERFNQIKHHGYNNLYSWQECLDLWDVKLEDIDAIAIVIDPEWHVNESFTTHPNILYERIKLKSTPFDNVKCPIFRIDHHYAHALSLWPVNNSINTYIIMDGYGDHEKSFSLIENDSLIHYETVRNLESIGRVLAEVGFRFGMTGHPQDFAGKLMGLQSYGKLDFELLQELEKYNSLYDTAKIYSTFNESEDWLRTVHSKFENLFVKFFDDNLNREETIGYSGGIAQNIVINSKLKEKFQNIHIPPHCPDEGLSLGCVEFLRKYYNQDKFDNSGFPFWQSDESPDTKPSNSTLEKVSEYLAEGKIIAWYQGNGEVGPRALGNRSILMNPAVKDGKNILNSRVKKREYYRPFGASILENHATKYFNCSTSSPYMLYSMEVLTNDFPSITHVDNTCRVQTVSDGSFAELLEVFNKKTGIPVLLNTSLNIAGKPIAGKIEDAVNLFRNNDIDILVIGDEVVTK